MRLTLPCLRTNLPFLRKQLWKTRGFLKEPRLIMSDHLRNIVKKRGTEIEDPLKWEQDLPALWRKPITEDSPALVKESLHLDDTNSMLQFDPHTVLLEGEKQACLLTKTQPFHELPQQITDLIGAAKIDGQDELVQRYIMQAHIWDPTKKKIRITPSPFPGWKKKRERGIPKAQKLTILQQNLLRLCQSLQGKFPDLAASRRLTVDFDVSASYQFQSERSIQINAHQEWMMTSNRPLTQFGSTDQIDESVQHKLPDLFPLSPLIDLKPGRGSDDDENITGWNSGATHRYPHTLFVGDHRSLDTSARNAKYLMFCFAHCLALAKDTYGTTTKTLPEPISTQCIATNGEKFNFVCFQLNTLNFDHTSGVKNFVWFDNDNAMFNRIQPKRAMLRNTKYEDYDPQVFRKYLAFYLSGAELFKT